MGLLDKLNPDKFTSVKDLLVADDIENILSNVMQRRNEIENIIIVVKIGDRIFVTGNSDTITSLGMMEMAKLDMIESSEEPESVIDGNGILKHKSYDDNGNLLEGDEDEKI